jgi:dCMP deaminase
MAREISRRSEDFNTKHGCVIVTQDNNPIGFGYNGYAKGIDTSVLPNTRPSIVNSDEINKYSVFLHSEINAISSCSVSPKLFSCTAYITGRPCLLCLTALINANIKKIVYPSGNSSFSWYEKERELFNYYVEESKIIVVET